MSTAILLIAHGSRLDEANEDLRHFANELEGDAYALVVASYLELASPNIDEGGRRCAESGADRVVLVPFFLSAGTHVQRDLSRARQQLADEYPSVEFVLAEPLGRHPLLLEILRDRIGEVDS